jgi:Raf kinase inhibitor-like YbhB/YbcL family protein
MSITITSPAFHHNDTIPARFTCSGADISPPLQWTGVPPETKSLVLIVDDPDAPDPSAPKMTWVHWILYNLPPYCDGLEEDIQPGALPEGTCEGFNDWNRTGYGGPCPPIGRHRYFFKLYALDKVLEPIHRATKAQVEKTMQNHVLASAELVGTFEK